MQEIMQVLAQGMSADIDRLSTVGMNIANIRTPGYKRMVAVGNTFEAMVEAGQQAAALDETRHANAARKREKLTDMRPGPLQRTGRPLDVAITGPYFFELTAQEGPVYSREGAFHLDAQGRLVGPMGYPVMGMSGEIRLNGSSPTIDAQGNVYEAGRQIDRIKLARIDHAERMSPLGHGLYAPGGLTADLAENGTTAVQQGYLEASNVDAGREMINVVDIVRHFESMQKVTQSYDDMTRQAVQKLGDLT